jgi:hypothetical protein
MYGGSNLQPTTIALAVLTMARHHWPLCIHFLNRPATVMASYAPGMWQLLLAAAPLLLTYLLRQTLPACQSEAAGGLAVSAGQIPGWLLLLTAAPGVGRSKG